MEEGRQSQAPAPPSSPECQGTSTQQSPHCADSASHMKSLSHGPLPCSESTANIYPSAPPGPRALAHSVPPGKAKRGQTCLPRQMIHHLDSPTVCLSRGVALPEDARRCQQQLRAQLGSAMSAELLQAPLAQPARLCFLTNTRADKWGELGPWGLRIHPVLVQKRKPLEVCNVLLAKPEITPHSDLFP